MIWYMEYKSDNKIKAKVSKYDIFTKQKEITDMKFLEINFYSHWFIVYNIMNAGPRPPLLFVVAYIDWLVG